MAREGRSRWLAKEGCDGSRNNNAMTHVESRLRGYAVLQTDGRRAAVKPPRRGRKAVGGGKEKKKKCQSPSIPDPMLFVVGDDEEGR